MNKWVSAVKFSTSAGLVLSAVLASAALAQTAPPPPYQAPPTSAIPAARDIAYPGTLKVSVDATDLDHRRWVVRQVVPTGKAGEMVLMTPLWLPGKHSVQKFSDKIANVRFSAGGKTLTWLRDPVAVNAFRFMVPDGVTEVVAEFEYLAPMTSTAGRIVQTDLMANFQWELASMYPAGYFTSRIPVQLTLKLPQGWSHASALEVESAAADNIVTFKPVSYETLIDSPMFAGKYYKQWDLTPAGKKPVRLNVFADKPEYMEARPEVIDLHRKMVAQSVKLFKSEHYDHYDFLVHLSEELGDIGLEHHRSSENGHDIKYFTDWANGYIGRDLLAHEFTHSWDGKFRRGADLYTPDFQEPMRGSLLWVYEGQTQYWGYMLTARSGMYSKDQAKEAIALIAAIYDNFKGTEWRPTVDTTNDPVISSRAPKNWLSMQRSEDYYNVGLLIWLDADTLIREKTGNTKSLDDFAGKFFGVKDGSWVPETYEFKEVVATLNSVYAYDWDTFLKDRLYKPMKGAPLDGLERGGYRLVYTATPTDWIKAREKVQKTTDLSYSLGLTLNVTGDITGTLWDGPAFKAGLGQGMSVVAVNGEAYEADGLKAAVTEAAKPDAKPIELLIKKGKVYRTVTIDYKGGLRYPRLERIAGKPTYLDDILTEKK